GPAAGRPREVGLLCASSRPFALDVAAVSAVGGDPAKVPTIAVAGRRGLPARLSDIDWLGTPLAEVRVSDFDFPARGGLVGWAARANTRVGKRVLGLAQPRPVFRHDRCTGCAECARNCPAKVITIRGDRPWVALDGCIRCFCCQELCPRKAVDIERPWLNRAIFR
ncbi:MAG: 4Fe-4S dicluster domain-containing protein, partial [Chloroflexota bacterium]